MAAFIPSRRDPEVNRLALEKVREDKVREAGDGFDGTWVAHPDLVQLATECFDAVLGERPNQIKRRPPDVRIDGRQLVDVAIPGSSITEAGLRLNVSVGIQYIESWLRGNGAAAINNLMEDAATAEISRSQVWQWVRNGARLAEGPVIDRELVRRIEDEELAKIRQRYGEDVYRSGRFEEARQIFDQVALADDFVEFLTLPAYDLID
jgi:malate synthase